MSTSHRPSRRTVLSAAAAAAVVPTFLSQRLMAADSANPPIRLRKAVKYDMIKLDGPIEAKFDLIKSLGFEGVEINSPSSVNREEAVAASKKTGIVIHGVIDSIHWDQRLSDPDEAVRAKGLAALNHAIDDCKTYGGTTVLLVPGRVKDARTENFQQCWDRSSAEVRKAIPHADAAGVKIAIETVWNDFITTPEQMVKYVDQFGTPTVGTYFDVSNMIKYGVPPADWIRTLGKRLLKFDFKGYSKAKSWCPIGEGDENWPEVLKALAEVGYKGQFATAEVGGGGADVLKDVSRRMDKILGLA
jgi:L-ribulose-5-phosphate 3-epimerase